MLKVLKVLLIIFVLLVLAGLVAWLVWAKGWPWWVGVAMLVGILGIWVGILFVKRSFLRRREKEFVRRVIAQDQAAIQTAPLHERQQLMELQEDWKKAVEQLLGSNLRKKGNPLYVLPWYVVIGESGAGKSSAIRNAGMNPALSENRRAAGITATRNCDWWFFENAIVLDTAGRYTIAIDQGPDQEEWQKFLVLLARYRRREPVNGVVVVVSAEKLLAGDSKALREDGQEIRAHLDQLMRGLGSKFPIYVLVTKLDFIHGLTEFAAALPPERLNQAMGFTNDKALPIWKDVLDQALNSIAGRLRSLRFILIHRSPVLGAGALHFPTEFESLHGGLADFLKPIFDQNSYQETPLLRGLFFSSARQGVTPYSQFLKMLEITPPGASQPVRDHGLFLTDFFRRILPRDRYLFSPLPEFLRWRNMRNNLGLLAWWLIWICLGGLLSLSFFLNVRTIRGFTEDFYNPPALSNDLATDLFMMDRLRLEVLEMQDSNRGWIIPRFGLRQSLRVEDGMRIHFLQLFGNGVLIPLDNELRHKVELVDSATQEALVVNYVGYLVTRINLIQSYLRNDKPGRDKPPALGGFKRASGELISGLYPGVPFEIASKFGDIYYTFLFLYRDRPMREAKLSELQDLLLQMLKMKGANLHWLVLRWIPGTRNIQLNDFWGEPEKVIDNSPYISGAFTGAGRRNILEFIALIDGALRDPAVITSEKRDFWVWYTQQFYDAWTLFAVDFSSGGDGLETMLGWQRMATLMTTEQNPYFVFLQRMAAELAALGDPAPPPWAVTVMELDRIRQLAEAESAKTGASPTLLSKLEAQKDKLVGRLKETISLEETRRAEQRAVSAKVWTDYGQMLKQIAPAIISKETCFNMACAYFPDSFSPGGPEPADSKSPFNIAYSDVVKLAGLVEGRTEFDFVWNLVVGPLRFLIDFSIADTACILQTQWREQVLGGLRGAGADSLPRLLFDQKEGLVWKFVNGTAGPFISRDRNGYTPRVVFERSIPFTQEFLEFLNEGAMKTVSDQPEYDVQIETVPLATNEGARVQPFAAILCLQCGEGKTCLENYNYPQNMMFKWEPDKCGDVTLTIRLPDLTLSRQYKGRLGFAKFAAEFMTGSQVFRAGDFPESKAQLQSLGIEWITVSYRISGSGPVIQTLRRTPDKVPTDIADCWSK